MGFGLPSAIGAKVAQPDTVVCLAGDGSLIMTCQELATAVRHEIPVKVFLMNNGYFGMVRQWQELFWEGRYSSVEMGPSPDWRKLAEAFGAKGMSVDDAGEVEGDAHALAADGPVLLDVQVSKEENCYPMIPAGSAAWRWSAALHLTPTPPLRVRGRGPRARPRSAADGSRDPDPIKLEDLGGRLRAPHRPQARALDHYREQARCWRGIAGLFSRRGFNIDTLAVGPTEDLDIARFTLTVDGASTRSTRSRSSCTSWST